jgi:hypothetical protein
MIARKLRSIEDRLREQAAARHAMTPFEQLHLAEVMAALADIAEQLEARQLPAHLRIVPGGKPERGDAA